MRRSRGRVTDNPDRARRREAVYRTREQLDTARERFHSAIRAAHAAGVSLRAIADDAGLSHQRVHQLMNEPSAASFARQDHMCRGGGRRCRNAVGA